MSDIETTYIVIVDGKAFTIDFSTLEVRVGTKHIGTATIDTTKIEPKTSEQYLDKDLLHLIINEKPAVFDMETNEFYEIVGDGTSIRKMGELVIRESETDTDIVEVLFMSDAKYLHNYSNNSVYNGTTLEYISPMEMFHVKQSKEISRGFINKDNSCYMDSVLFALTYRDSPFLNKHIFNVNPSEISPDNDPTIASAIEKNQRMLLGIRAWLQDAQQQKNARNNPVCSEFRQNYKSVRSIGDGEYEILHDKKWETTMEDSGDFLLDIFNTFQIRTLREKTTKTGFNKTKVPYTYGTKTVDMPPFLIVPFDISTDSYFKRTDNSTVKKGDTVRQYVFRVVENSEEAREKNEKLYREFLTKKLDIIVKFLNEHQDRILPASSLAIFQKEIKALNTRSANFDTSNDFMDRVIEHIRSIPDLKEEFDTNKPYEVLMSRYQNNILRFEDVLKYEPIYPKPDDPSNSLLVFNVDRTKLGDMSIHKGRKISFDIQENIQGPAGNLLGIQFIIVREGEHYYCVFKHIQDGGWYIYDDTKPKFERIGAFSKLPKKIYTHCTLLFYGTQA
jgi:hypothetical protein